MNFVAVFDTNILLSSASSVAGNPFRCLTLAREGTIQSVTCSEILDEFREKLVDKFKVPPDAAQSAIDEVRKISQVVTISGALSGILPDPDDHKVLECAVAGNATHIVTGDKKHLLPLAEYQNIRIVTAADFLAAALANE